MPMRRQMQNKGELAVMVVCVVVGFLLAAQLRGVQLAGAADATNASRLETLQSLDPAGVGARSLSECLLLQLARQDAPSPLDMEIVRRFLPDLGKKHYSLIARELHTTPEEVRAAEKRISALDPCPGRSFQPAEPTLYVRPDLFIAELDGKLQVILNDYYLPRVSISQYYVRLLKNPTSRRPGPISSKRCSRPSGC